MAGEWVVSLGAHPSLGRFASHLPRSESAEPGVPNGGVAHEYNVIAWLSVDPARSSRS